MHPILSKALVENNYHMHIIDKNRQNITMTSFFSPRRRASALLFSLAAVQFAALHDDVSREECPCGHQAEVQQIATVQA